MSNEFKLPDIGEGLAEGEIVKWLVSVGEAVQEDQPLVEVMTDKATVEIPSPRAGVVAELLASEGEIIEIGTTILVFGDGDGGATEAAVETAPPAAEAGVSDREIQEAREVARAERSAAEGEAAAQRKPWEAPELAGGAVAPAARRLAAELGVDIGGIAGTGPGGILTKDDVRSLAAGRTLPAVEVPVPAATAVAQPAGAVAGTAAEAGDETAAALEEPPVEAVPEREAAAVAEGVVEVSTPEPEPEPAAVVAATAEPDGQEERLPLRGLRRVIAERMVLATTTVPHYTYVEEVDMTEVVALRQEGKAIAAERGTKLTYLPFIIRALVMALQQHPYLNASLDEEAGEIVLKRYYNIGVATNTDRGLMVPVIKGADGHDLFSLAAEITRLSDAARDGSIGLEDLQGGTFTITSTGNIGGFLATPLINVPEVAILGVTSIRERPVALDGRVVIRHMLNLSLSCDHRVVDGAVAALFVRDLVKLLQDPKLQLLGSLGT